MPKSQWRHEHRDNNNHLSPRFFPPLFNHPTHYDMQMSSLHQQTGKPGNELFRKIGLDWLRCVSFAPDCLGLCQTQKEHCRKRWIIVFGWAGWFSCTTLRDPADKWDEWPHHIALILNGSQSGLDQLKQIWVSESVLGIKQYVSATDGSKRHKNVFVPLLKIRLLHVIVFVKNMENGDFFFSFSVIHNFQVIIYSILLIFLLIFGTFHLNISFCAAGSGSLWTSLAYAVGMCWVTIIRVCSPTICVFRKQADVGVEWVWNNEI